MKQWLTNGRVAVDVEREFVIEPCSDWTLTGDSTGDSSIAGDLTIIWPFDTKLALNSQKCF